MLSFGSQDTILHQHDIRDKRIAAKREGHVLQLCGLEWNNYGVTFASGGNENYVCIWDVAMLQRCNSLNSENDFVQPRQNINEHEAAVSQGIGIVPFVAMDSQQVVSLRIVVLLDRHLGLD